MARMGENKYMCNEFFLEGGGGWGEHEENRPLEKPSRCKWENDIKNGFYRNGME